MSNVMRPDPILRIDSAPFWEACQNEELRFQKFKGSDKFWHPPRAMCPETHTTEKTFEKVSGKGKILTWARQVRPAAFFFAESPIVILVELDEGIRFISNLVGVEDVSTITSGMRVEVEFAPTSGGKKVPVFRPVEA